MNKKSLLSERIVKLHANYLTLMAVHGALCLALRHPQFKGQPRQLVVRFTEYLGEWLVYVRAWTPEQLAEAKRLEAEAGSNDLS